MAKELFKPLYSPPGWKYADAKAAGMLRESPTYWIRLWHPTEKKVIRESTSSTNYEAAKEYLRKRRAAFDTGKPHVVNATKVTFSDMARKLEDDYKANRQNLGTLKCRLLHLEPFFGNRRMASLKGADIASYRTKRQGEGAGPSSLNRELSALARAFSLGRELELLNETTLNVRMYHVAENPPRSGFFEAPQFESVMRHLTHIVIQVVNGKRRKIRIPADDLQLACLIAYRLGWRKNEILNLERRHVALDAAGGMGTLSLDPGSTKNDEGRTVVLPPDVKAAIGAQLQRLDAFQKQSGRVCRYLFTRTIGREAGKRIRDFRRVWATACKQAGVPAAIFHDFRRTAVRGMVNATVPERVAMKITGHKTRSIFDRYHIVSPGDLQRAALLMATANQQSESLTQGASKD